MNIYCNDLSLNIYPLIDSIKVIVHEGIRIPIHKLISEDKISDQLKKFLSTLNLTVGLAETFYTPPNMRSNIHSDTDVDDFVKINFIFGGTNSKMHWYSIKNSVQTVKTTNISTFYIPYNPSDVEHIFTSEVNFPSIIQAGIPHNIENFTEPRYCLSVVPFSYGKPLRMTQSLDIFKDYLTNLTQ